MESEKMVPLYVKAEEWQVTVRVVQVWCKQGRIPGAIKVGKSWSIPENSVRPTDSRYAVNKEIAESKKMDETAVLFISNLSRDIRTSLNTIFGYSDMIIAEDKKAGKNSEYARNIQIAGKSITDLLNNIMHLANLESGNYKPDETVCNIKDIITECVNENVDEAVHKKIDVVYNFNNVHDNVSSDEKMLSSIFKNIINNAITYSKEKGTVTITVDENDTGKTDYSLFRYTIDDSGMGMTDDFVEHVFDAFAKNDDNNPGSGLGMTITKGLVNALSGSIEVKSIRNHGTQVVVELEQKTIPNTGEMSTYEGEIPEYMKGMKILLAEDIDINREIATEVLETAGFVVDTATDGIMCLAKHNYSAAGTYDLILMDLQMPNMDGISATKFIRGMEDEAKAAIPIIAMTASVSKEDRKTALEAGMDGYVEKPMEMKKLVEAIERIKK